MGGWGPRAFPGGGGGGGGSGGNELDDPFVEYQETNASAGETKNIIDFTTDGTQPTHLIRIEFGGQNIGDYRLLINDVLKARFITWFNGPMDGFWDFSIPTFGGFQLPVSTNIKVQVFNNRPTAADYFAKMTGALVFPIPD